MSILPFVLLGVPFPAQLAMTRRGDKIRWAVAAIMRKCGQPVALSNRRAVVERWQQIRLNPRPTDIIEKKKEAEA
jgi:hypothetical protein